MEISITHNYLVKMHTILYIAIPTGTICALSFNGSHHLNNLL